MLDAIQKDAPPGFADIEQPDFCACEATQSGSGGDLKIDGLVQRINQNSWHFGFPFK
jgi:hypothetical protein